MCVVSMIGDHYRDKWKDDIWKRDVQQPLIVTRSEISRAEFDRLKRDVEEMKELLKRAKKYDEENGEPDCEIDEKMDLLRKIAELVGISLDDVIGKTVKAK